MISRRNLDKSLASEGVDLLFYLIIEKKGKRMLKPLKIDTKVPLKLVRAIADDTIIPSFYSTLAKNLRERGVAPGSKVQLRAKFSPSHEMIDPVLKGTRILCEVDV
ncbi:hypothetical protein KKB44_00845 [Candidatus Micrarchaeota archaeon]|nr:hypothetical protein [Candidatus Micrarchaeota archaeon]